MHTPPPCCPRCEYELTGEANRWHEQCPLEGICPECGLALQWRDVYQICNEWGSEVGWYAEHAHSALGMLKRTPGTLLRLIFPHRYFRDMNHRREIRPLRLALWILLASVLVHLIVSPIGYAANKAEGYPFYRNRSQHSFVEIRVDEISAAISFPFGLLPFEGYEWYDYMLPTWAIIGAPIFWIFFLGFVLLVRHEEDKDYRRDMRLLVRMSMLSILPAMMHIQIVRLGFGIHAATGMTHMTDGVPIAFLISIFAMLFWQQLLWTHAVRRYWHIQRSFFINIGGCFGSVIFGVVFMIWVLR